MRVRSVVSLTGGLSFAAACGSFATETAKPADDGGTRDGAPPASFCSTVDASFCWSFDEVVPGFRQEYGPRLLPLGPRGLDASARLIESDASAPGALRVSVLADGDGGTFAGAAHAIEPRSAVRCEADLAIRRPGKTSVLALGFITERFNEHIAINLNGGPVVTANVVVIEPDGSALDGALATAVPTNAWFHVKLEVSGAGAANAGVRATLPNSQPTIAFGDVVPGKIKEARVAVIVSLSADDWVVDYDNFLCSYE